MNKSLWAYAIAGCFAVLFGWSMVAWGNWFPIAAKINSPTTYGIVVMILGGLEVLIVLGLAVWSREG